MKLHESYALIPCTFYLCDFIFFKIKHNIIYVIIFCIATTIKFFSNTLFLFFGKRHFVNDTILKLVFKLMGRFAKFIYYFIYRHPQL